MSKAAVVDNFDELMKRRKEPEEEKPKSYIQQVGDVHRREAAEHANVPAAKPKNLRPLSNRVIIKPAEAEIFLDEGKTLLKAAEYREKPMEGTVICCGPGSYLANGKFVETSVKVGERVMYGKHAGSPITLADGEMLIMLEEEILGVVEE